MSSDPIRDALAEVVRRHLTAAARNVHVLVGAIGEHNDAERAIGAQAALDAYDSAKLMHGDTSEATTVKIPTRRRKK